MKPKCAFPPKRRKIRYNAVVPIAAISVPKPRTISIAR